MAKVLTGAKEASPKKAGSEAPAVPVKELYEVGEIPPRGHVPAKMHAWVIRRERHGEPEQAMQVEVVDTPTLHSHAALVMVMAAAGNYTVVWTRPGVPITPFEVHQAPYNIAGSNATRVVW